MIGQSVLDDVPLSQGDLFTECPLLMREESAEGRRLIEQPMQVIALT